MSFQAYTFLNVLLNPESNVNFIYKVGIMIFLIEFLSIHSSFMLSGLSKMGKTKYLIILAYIMFATVFSLVTKSYMPALFFVLGLISNVTSSSKEIRLSPYPIITLFVSLFASLMLEGVLHKLFAMPESVIVQKPGNSSGTFVDAPETLLAWGFIYYVLNIVIQLWRIKRGGTLPYDFIEHTHTEKGSSHRQ